MSPMDQLTTQELLEEVERRTIAQKRIFIYILSDDDSDSVHYAHVGNPQMVLGQLRFMQEQVMHGMMTNLLASKQGGAEGEAEVEA